jgi:hypothetical protein
MADRADWCAKVGDVAGLAELLGATERMRQRRIVEKQ